MKTEKQKNIFKKRTNKVSFAIVLTIMILALFGKITFALSDIDSAFISITPQSVTPYPVEPGEDFTIQILISNSGKETGKNLKLELQENENFYLSGKEDNFANFDLCSNCNIDNRFYFTTSSDTKSGEYPLIFKLIDGTTTKEEKVFIRVIGKPEIIFNAEILDKNISPGNKINMQLSIKNVGSGIAKKVKIIPQTENFVMENENLIFIDEISPNKNIIKNITIIASDSLATGPHKISFKIENEDEKSNTYNKEQNVGVLLLNNVNLNLASAQWYPQELFIGKYSQLTIRVENPGEGKAKDITVEIESNNLEGNKKAYIGQLEEGEDSAAIFDLKPNTFEQNSLNLIVSYTDDLGKHNIKQTIPVTVKEISNMPYYIGFGIIIGVILIVFLISLSHKK